MWINLNFVDICPATSYPFGFTSGRKSPPLDTLIFSVTALSNKDKKVVFIQVGKYGALSICAEFMSTCHNMNIIVKTTGGDEYSLNGKIVIPDKILKNITRDLLLK